VELHLMQLPGGGNPWAMLFPANARARPSPTLKWSGT
jgi:hypothetical protein